MKHGKIVVGITGASGAPYAIRLIRMLTECGIEAHVAVSALGRRLLFDEADIRKCEPEALVGPDHARLVTVHNDNDMGSTIASGSFLHDGMVIVPCSSNTMGALAAGMTNSLVHRAASVTLKEGRRLVIAHRETPLGRIELMNMERLLQAGAVIAPLSPGFYMRPESIDEMVDFMVGRLLDLLGIDHDLSTRWESSPAR
ncbi:MAG: UbiX family flavin prenyltransferase [Planctomycetota bacterium]|nr:UbiX family flavin prenyltransferase [Planctomycetota bacterium]